MDSVTITPAEARLKRMRMRAWRRGTKEMDMILGPYADAALAEMGASRLDLFERLLGENDHDIYQWITGQVPAPDSFAGLIGTVQDFCGMR